VASSGDAVSGVRAFVYGSDEAALVYTYRSNDPGVLTVELAVVDGMVVEGR
jgi:hypothetical protein